MSLLYLHLHFIFVTVQNCAQSAADRLKCCDFYPIQLKLEYAGKFG